MHAPALLTSTSARPQDATVSSSIRSTSARRVTSPSTVRTPTPSAPISSRTGAAGCWSRPTTTTFAPASARARAKALPRPLVAPVTTAVLPVRLNLSRTDMPPPPPRSVEAVRVRADAQAAVQPGEGRQILVCELELHRAQVLLDPRRGHRLRNHDVTDRQMPREHDLGGRRVVLLGDPDHLGVGEHLRLALPERRPRLGDDAQLAVGLAQLPLLVERMELHLIHDRHDAGLVHQPSQVMRLEVRHPDRPDTSLPAQPDQRAPGLDVLLPARARPVDEVQVERLQPEPADRRVE